MNGRREFAQGSGPYLVVGRLESECVGEKENDFVFGVLAGGGGDVAVDASNLSGSTCRTRELLKSPSCSQRGIPSGIPSWRTPVYGDLAECCGHN